MKSVFIIANHIRGVYHKILRFGNYLLMLVGIEEWLRVEF